MPGRAPAEAVTEFTRALQRMVDCITTAVFGVSRGGYVPAGQPHSLSFATGIPVPVGKDPRLHLDISLRYRVLRDEGAHELWKVQVVGYIYTVRDHTYAPLLAFHWHPHGGSRVNWPHLHIYEPALRPASLLAKAHIPTGPIAVEDVIRLLIAEFGVGPRRGHGDWDSVLAQGRRELEQQQTWA